MYYFCLYHFLYWLRGRKQQLVQEAASKDVSVLLRIVHSSLLRGSSAICLILDNFFGDVHLRASAISFLKTGIHS